MLMSTPAKKDCRANILTIGMSATRFASSSKYFVIWAFSNSSERDDITYGENEVPSFENVTVPKTYDARK